MTDHLVVALRDLGDSLARNRERIDRIVAKADELCVAREGGEPWATIVGAHQGTMVIELLGQNLDELYGSGGRVRRSLARALYAEGLSMERIARLFGVTRQRVSALLRTDGSVNDEVDLPLDGSVDGSVDGRASGHELSPSTTRL